MRHRAIKYGYGREIASCEHEGYRLVAIGSRFSYSKTWLTFHDSLMDYIKGIVGVDWGNSEIAKPLKDRHVIMQWYDDVCAFQREHIKVPGQVHTAVMTGSIAAYVSLSYDLYTLQHNIGLPEPLVTRLKHPQLFQGARYELYVAAALVRAGFVVEIEDETDVTTTHCDFAATCRLTGKNYSVEVKSRHRKGLLGRPGRTPKLVEIRLDVRRLLREALKKSATHRRIVFVDINMPPEKAGTFETSWFQDLGRSIERREKVPIDGQPCPSAYVVATNHPYHYVGNDAPEPGRNFLMTGVGLPWLKVQEGEDGELATWRFKVEDQPVMRLFDSLVQHTEVPHEFE